MGEFADDAVDREIDDLVREYDEPGEWDGDESPFFQDKREKKRSPSRRERRFVGEDCGDPLCGGKLVERVNRKTGTHFLGCNKFPTCRKSYSIMLGKGQS